MLNICKEIAMKYNRRKWIPYFKIWVGIQFIYDNNLQPFTIKQLSSLTNMSANSIYNYIKDLKEEQVFEARRIYADIDKCIGQKALPNAFYYENQFNQIKSNQQESDRKIQFKKFSLK